MDCKLEQLAPVSLILCYHLEFKTSWHVLSLPLAHAHSQIVSEMSGHLDITDAGKHHRCRETSPPGTRQRELE